MTTQGFQYRLNTGLMVIAECERCGRGFVHLGENATMRDPFLPQRGSYTSFGNAICNGRIVLLRPVFDWREYGL